MFQMLQQVLHVASLFISRHVKSVRKGGPYVLRAWVVPTCMSMQPYSFDSFPLYYICILDRVCAVQVGQHVSLT
jgi:hypothetical protein